MRWQVKGPSNQRTRTRFLFWPRTIDGECRWLERTAWEERYVPSYAGGEWQAVRWVD